MAVRERPVTVGEVERDMSYVMDAWAQVPTPQLLEEPWLDTVLRFGPVRLAGTT